MPLPNLIHPVDVTIERFNASEMLMDADTRSPIHGARSASGDTVIIEAQIKIDDADMPDHGVGGDRLIQSGYILCRTVDMDNVLGAGQRLKKGDHIIAIGVNTGLDLYITKNQRMGHYPDQNGASLIRYYFEDRNPVQVT